MEDEEAELLKEKKAISLNTEITTNSKLDRFSDLRVLSQPQKYDNDYHEEVEDWVSNNNYNYTTNSVTP